jgi:hypothetical protein
MTQLTMLLNASVAGAWGNETGDSRGRAPGYFFKLTCEPNGVYTVSYEAFTQSNVYSLAARVRNNTATVSDYSLLWRLQSGYDPYEHGPNLYRDFLFLTDPSHSAALSDAQLQEALGLMKSSSYIPKYTDPELEASAGDLHWAYVAALADTTYDELFGYLNGLSILQAAAGVSEFLRGIMDMSAEYSAAYNRAIISGLDPNVRNAFASDIKVSTLKRATTVYRYYGAGSEHSSNWYTPYQVDNPKLELALPPGNTAEYMDTVVLPRGTRVIEGTVAPRSWNGGPLLPGGGYQYYILP